MGSELVFGQCSELVGISNAGVISFHDVGWKMFAVDYLNNIIFQILGVVSALLLEKRIALASSQLR